MSNDERASSWLRTLLVVAVVWLFIAGFLVILLWPYRPRSALQWVLLVAIGPPLYAFGEGLVEFISDHPAARRAGRYVSSHWWPTILAWVTYLGVGRLLWPLGGSTNDFLSAAAVVVIVGGIAVPLLLTMARARGARSTQDSYRSMPNER